MRAEAQPGSRGAPGDVAARCADLARRLPVDDEPGALVRSAADDRGPREFEQIRLDGREVADRDRDGLEPSAAAGVRGPARDAVDLGGQTDLVPGAEYRRAADGRF